VLLHLEVAIGTTGEGTVIVALTTLKIGCSLAIGGGHLGIEGGTIVNMKIATLTLDLKQEDLLSKKLLRKVSKCHSLIILIESVLYVGNLPFKATEEMLCEIFSLYGRITSCDLV
jgi:hypothetical protein